MIKELGVLAVFCLGIGGAQAAPFIEPGDAAARRDVDLLAAHGFISGPTTSWPLPWAQVIGALDNPDLASRPHLDAAARRLKAKYHRAVTIPSQRFKGIVQAEGSTSPQLIRGFEGPPRDYAEARIGVERAWNGASLRLLAGGDREVGGDTDVNFDGSFAAWQGGNVLIHAGLTEHWWGPGHDGALQLSNNARPFPMVSITRVRPLPFESDWFSWIGPWRLTGFAGVLTDNRAVDHPFYAGMRAEIEPLPGLQIGASRTMQFCGEGIQCNAESLFDTLIGADNNPLLGSQSPGSGTSDQQAGIDARYATAFGDYDVEVYAEIAGEDQAGFLPSKNAYMGGAGIGGPLGTEGARFHVYGEYANTADAGRNIFYTSALYPSGNTFDGEVIGHSIESDAELYTLGGSLDFAEGMRIWGRIGVADLNRDGTAPNAAFPTSFPNAQRLGLFDAGTNFEVIDGRAEIGLGLSYVTDNINRGRRARDQIGGSMQLNLNF